MDPKLYFAEIATQNSLHMEIARECFKTKDTLNLMQIAVYGNNVLISCM